MFGFPEILRLRVLLLVGLIAPISLSTNQIASAQTTAPNQWTWVGGSSTAILMPDDIQNGSSEYGQPGVYGTQGMPASGNMPGSRSGASTWTDSSGNLWLFGGMGYDASGNGGYLNDLWEFIASTNEWVWISGSSVMPCVDSSYYCGVSGVNGVVGVPNAPGGRLGASNWMDSSGNLWLFGGSGVYVPNPQVTSSEAQMPGDLNDLWEFTLSTKTWTLVTGSDMCPSTPSELYSSSCYTVSAHYGSLGEPAAGNTPGERGSAGSWTDKSGNFWLFGGDGTDGNGTSGWLNDLWEFNSAIGEWAWMGGSSTVGSGGFQQGVYGPLGTPSTTYIPSGRSGSSTWTDSNGNLWLFGGYGAGLIDGSLKSVNYLNDLWKFDATTGEWAWMSGSNILPEPSSNSTGVLTGVYGILGTPAAGNVPGGRFQAASWTDKSGNLWLFGGNGYDSTGNFGVLNDLWKFNPATSQWTWMAGSNAILESYSGDPGVYGTLGAPAAGNIPGARMDAATWTDKDGNLWLFGGEGLGGDNNWSDNNWGDLNDLWVYQPSTEPLPAAAVPTVSSVSPNYATAGTTIPDVIFITVNGSGFTSSSTVYWGSKVLSTEHDSATKLTTGLPATFMTTAGIIPITVQTPAPGGGTSNSSVSFTVGSATGAITGPTIASPTATVTAGSLATYAVTLPSSLTNATVSCQNLPTGATCSYSGGTLTIATSSTTPKGIYQINVVFTEAVASAATASILLPILLLPLVFLRRKQAARGAWTTACLGLVVMAAMTVACVGCSGGGNTAPTPTPAPTTHQVTSSVAVLLTVQ